ncbi:MAG: hypothetical protein V2I27_03545 [Erythrobacter sp.]|jgi:hypothetical protein|nr:hypothetical protein [Erythrobacter sp.]
MLLAAALILAAPAAAEAQAEPIPEIVVLGNLRALRVNVAQDGEGRWHCGLDRSTGRPKIDEKLCRAVTKCVRKGANGDAEVETCVRESRGGLVRQVERELKKGSS